MITLGYKMSFILVDWAVYNRTSKITRLGIINFLSTKEILTSVSSKTFCEIRELISFCRAKVHFSGLGDFAMDDIERGIQTEDEDSDEGR